MDRVVVIAIGVAFGLGVVGAGVRLILRGRREGRLAEAGSEERMVASFSVATGVRRIGTGAVLLVLAGIVAFVWPR